MKLSKFQHGLIFAFGLTILETIGQTLLRKFYLQKDKNLLFPFITWLFYGFAVIILYISYSYVNEGEMEVLWNAGTNTIIPIAGLLFFGENLNLLGWFGVLLTLIGGTLLGISKNN
tara:strand:+ start:4505 stop:4852 length:348 start_codon:yes stop_codon:yes gene_type:complete